MGDLAAGTMVIKEKKTIVRYNVSLDEFDYLTKDYHPVYPQSADLSLEQVNVITRTLQSSEKDRPRRILLLAQKRCRSCFPLPTRQQSGEIPSNSASGLSVLCIEEI